jgi:hypothetical protein
MLKVSNKTLLVFTGIIWLIASAILISRSYNWALELTTQQLLIIIPIGIVLAIIKTKLIFIKLNRKNIQRIRSFKTNISLWEFHLNKDKVLIILMIIIGIALRSSGVVPIWILMPIYLGVGLAMLYVTKMYSFAFFKNAD